MTEVVEAVAATAPRRRRGRAWQWIPVAIIAVYVLTAVFGPLLIDFDPVATPLADRLLPPGSATAEGTALLGTDGLGRDVFAQVVYGARTSITIAVLTVAVSALAGLAVGIVAGYTGGFIDAFLSRSVDVLLAFPGIVLAIVVAGLFDRSVAVVVIALALTGWIGFARLSRGSALSLRERDWVAAARVMGVSWRRIMTRHILPFVVGPVVALATIEFGLVVLAEAGLSFLGIGLPPSAVSWGKTIAGGRDYLATAWWISTFPGIALALLVVSVGLLGDQFNARARNGHSRNGRSRNGRGEATPGSSPSGRD